MESFNVGNLISSVTGAVAKVGTAISEAASKVSSEAGSIYNAVMASIYGALAVTAISDFGENGKLGENKVLLKEILKAVLGAFICTFGSGSSESDLDTDSESDFDFPIQVTDGAAVKYDKNGPAEDPVTFTGAFSTLKKDICNGAEKGVENIKEEWEKVKDKHIILGAGIAVSASNGVRLEGSESIQFDISLKGFDADVLLSTGGGVGSSSLGGGPFVQASVADNGISDLLGDGKNSGTSIGPLSADYSTADHAKTYTYNIGKGALGVKLPIEVHTSDTKTYSLKESIKDIGSNFEYEYNKWEEEIIQQALQKGNN